MLTSGVIGCGKASTTHHFPVIDALEGLELEWVCDEDENRAKEAAVENDTTWYSDSEEAIKDTPDIVHINTPPFTHHDLTIKALQAGAHVLVEKPMAMTVEECKEMERVQNETGRQLCVVHNNLFFDPIRPIFDGIHSGDFGDVLSVRSFLGGPPNRTENREWVYESHGKGPISDRLPHPIYLVSDFMDDIENISIETKSNDKGELNRVSVQLSSGDTFGSIQIVHDAIPSKSVYFDGTKRRAIVDLFNYSSIQYSTLNRSPVTIAKDNLSGAGQLTSSTLENIMGFAYDKMTSGNVYAGPGHYHLLKRFIQSIENDTTPPVPPSQGRKAVRILERIQEVYDQNQS